MPLTVGIIGAALWGNRGAEAMICTTVGKVREAYPEARCIVFSYFPKHDRQLTADGGACVEVHDASPAALVLHFFPWSLLYGLLRLIGVHWPRRLLPAPVRALADADVLLDVFGISYADGREKFLPFNLLSNVPALLMGIPLVKLAQGMGPYRHRLTRVCAKFVLRRCVRVYARGAKTYELTAALGLGDRLGSASDIALLYRPEYSLTRENEEYVRATAAELERVKESGTRIVTLSVSSVVFGKCRRGGIDYVGAMRDVTQALCSQGYAVVLFPNATRAGVASTRNNDLPVIAAIQQDLAGSCEQVIAIDRDLNTQALRELLQRTDYLVASRFHAMIAGLAAGMPTMVLGWGHKYGEILDEFGIGEWAWDYGQLDAAELLERIAQFIAAAPALREEVNRGRAAVMASAQGQFDWLVPYLQAKAGKPPESQA
jgi:colanic acid/amylovoran biosynthesis protein